MAQDKAILDEAVDTAWRVQGEMTIYRAVEISQSLFAAMRARHGDFELDLSQITEFDTAGLQILLMAREFAAASGHRFEITYASACVEEVLQLCNVSMSAEQVAA